MIDWTQFPDRSVSIHYLTLRDCHILGRARDHLEKFRSRLCRAIFVPREKIFRSEANSVLYQNEIQSVISTDSEPDSVHILR